MKELVTMVKVLCHGVGLQVAVFRRMENMNMVMPNILMRVTGNIITCHINFVCGNILGVSCDISNEAL
jgi:hypothetical protein